MTFEQILPFLTRLSGWLALGFLFLNFLTCWATPWSRKCQGRVCKLEELEEEPRALGFYHKYLVWPAIIFAIIHLILGIFE
jgi:succinate dehydrogenase/fumarate reductase cytochrome b subunit